MELFLCLNKQGKVKMVIGNHLLEGVTEKLKKPMLVCLPKVFV